MNRKHLRTLLLLGLLALCMCLAAGCSGSAQESENEGSNGEAAQETTAGAWYDELLADEDLRKDYPYYRVLDINGDGTDELFLSSTERSFIGNSDKARLVAEVNGAPKDLKEIGGAAGESFSFYAPDKALFYYSRISGEEHLVKYALENGELKELSTADQYDDHHDPGGDNKHDTHYLDGKKVSEHDFDAFWDQFDDDSEHITYSETGEANPAADRDADDDGDDEDEDDGEDD